MSQLELIEKKIKELDSQSLNEVNNLLDSLLKKKAENKETYLQFDWAGGLKDLREKYTSIELQKKAMDWWIEKYVPH
ncbi:MAG: DUF2281 domain-containing protein [Chitinophagales bacterium]|nr:DUF2281 domain-containing protein [Chitinophagales bacterium]